MAQPQFLICLQLDFASVSDGLAYESLELGNELVCIDQFRPQCLPPGKGEKLRGQFCSPISGASRGLGAPADVAGLRCTFDQFEVRGNHRKEVVEVVRDAAGKLSDRLHLLTLMELLFHQTARLQGVLVFSDIPEEDREALAGWKRIDCVPGLGSRTEHFEEGRTLL